MSESVNVTIIEFLHNKEIWPSQKYQVIVKATPEFMNEPKEMVSDKQRAEYISQRIKEEFYKFLTRKG